MGTPSTIKVLFILYFAESDPESDPESESEPESEPESESIGNPESEPESESEEPHHDSAPLVPIIVHYLLLYAHYYPPPFVESPSFPLFFSIMMLTVQQDADLYLKSDTHKQLCTAPW